MRKRIQKFFLILCLLTVAFSGCGAKTKVEEKTVDDGVSKTEIANLGTDDSSQNYWFTNVHNFAKGNGGYYYMSENSTYLCFFDESLGESYYVCNKSNCQHDDEDCNAYLRAPSKKDNKESKVGYTIETIYFYNGYLYLLDNEGYLVRFSADGSERKRICILDNYPHDGSTGTNLVDQYAYISSDSNYIYINNYLWRSLARRAGVAVDATSKVLDKAGREVSVIDSSDIYTVYWGDENYIFADGVSTIETSGLKYIKKSEISTSTEWRDLP